MDDKSGSARGFVSAALALVGVLVVAYLVFILVKMARSDGAKQTLAVLGIALAAGTLATGLGMLRSGRG